MTRTIFTIVLSVSAFLAGNSGAPAQAGRAKQTALAQCLHRTVSVPPGPGTLASDGNQIFVGYLNGTIEALSSGTLESNWRSELGGEFVSDLALLENGIAVVTNPSRDGNAAGEQSTVRLLSKESGITTWAAKVGYSERYFIGRINGSLAVVSKGGQVALLDRNSGQVHWQTMPIGRLSARPVFSATSVALATVDKHLTVISAQGGRVISRQPTDFVSTAITYLEKDSIAAGDERGNVTLFSSEISKTVWRFKSGAAVSSVSETEEGILVTSLDNFVYLISDYNGDVIWKRRLTGRVLDGGLAINGHFVVFIYGENSGFVMSLDEGRLTDAVPSLHKDLVNRVPVLVRGRTFVLTTVDSVDLFSLGGCEKK